jgi:probable FeS assembly SUF system protein SufT
MQMHKEVTTTRDVEAREIPSGMKLSIPEGTPLAITQSLGGSYTVITPYGSLARIDGKDGDAIGQEAVSSAGSTAEGKTTEELAWEQLKTCYDPEIPVNIVDLGLVYKCEATALPDGGKKIEVRFTLTAPGCGMGDVLKEDIRGKLLTLPDVREAEVHVMFDPPWNMSMMSEAAKLQLGLM